MTVDQVIEGLRGRQCFMCRQIAEGLAKHRMLTPLVPDNSGECHLPVKAQAYHIKRELGLEARRAVEEIEVPME